MEPRDGQQMGQPRIPDIGHHLGGYAAALAGQKGRRDRPRRPVERVRDPLRDRLAERRQGDRQRAALAAARADDLGFAQHETDGADAAEIIAPGEVEGAGRGRPRRRHQNRAHGDPLAWPEERRAAPVADADQSRGFVGGKLSDRQAVEGQAAALADPLDHGNAPGDADRADALVEGRGGERTRAQLGASEPHRRRQHRQRHKQGRQPRPDGEGGKRRCQRGKRTDP